MKISVIIPVYNTNIDIVKRTLDSIAVNNFENKYEVLLIDDGSQQENCKLYKELSKQYKCVKYFYKKNSGVSDTRNYGITKATGEFITFVDSDDEVIFNKISNDVLNLQYDFIIFNFNIIDKDNNKKINYELDLKDTCEIDYYDVLKMFVENDKCYSPFAKFFKREFVIKNNIKFDTKMFNGEDALFNLDILLSKPKIKYYSKEIYNYYYLENNFDKRLKKDAARVIDNYMYKYYRKNIVMNEYNFDSEIKKKVDNAVIDQMFRICMICFEQKIDANTEINNVIVNFKDKYKILTIKNKFKYKLMKNKRWVIIRFLSKCRNVYIKYR